MDKINFNEWYDSTPADWSIQRMKNIMYPRGERSVNGEEELLSVTIHEGVIKRAEYMDEDEGTSRADSLEGYKVVSPTNLVNNIMKMSFRCLGVSAHEGIVSPAYSVFELNQSKVDPSYINFLLRIDRYVTEYRKLSKGIQESRMRLYDDYFLAMKVIVPPLDEQKLIARYLEKKTNQIDSLINKFDEKIELLKEQRISLINHYVTKGLDPNVEMKDSGVEWIGEIPKHWDFLPIKRILEDSKESMRTGPFGSELKSSDFVSNGYRVYNQRTVYDHEYFQNDIFIDEDKFKKLNTFQVQVGDLLVTTRGTIGRLSIVPEDVEPGVIHPCLIRFRTNDELIEKNYLVKYFNESSLFITNVLYESNSTTIEVIYSETLRNIHLPTPPLEEQRLILDFINEKLKRTDCLIQKENRRIMLLKEYRQSLISSVVTGKVRVTEEMI